MYIRDAHHDGCELFDLHFCHVWGDWSRCCHCGEVVWLGEPEVYGSLLALLHRMECG